MRTVRMTAQAHSSCQHSSVKINIISIIIMITNIIIPMAIVANVKLRFHGPRSKCHFGPGLC